MPLRLSRRSKYGNRKTVVDGIPFMSKAEAKHYQELRYRMLAGEIHSIGLQEPFELAVNGRKVCTYVADFTVRFPDGEVRVEDTKGFRTRIFRLKAKLFEAVMGFSIHEIR